MTATIFVGCIGGSSVEQKDARPHFRWGLGLDVPAELPSRGPFLEPVGEVQFWSSFFTGKEHVDAFKEPCAPDSGQTHYSAPEHSVHIYVIFLFNCTRGHGDLDELADAARTSLAEARATIDAVESYANISSVEVAAMLMGQYLAYEHDFHRLSELRGEWRNLTEEQHSWMTLLYRRQNGGAHMLNRMWEIARLEGSACRLSNDRLANETMAGLRALVQDTARQEVLFKTGLGSNNYELGRLVNVTYPNAARAVELGWWPYLYAIAGQVPAYDAYFAYAQEGRLATFEEARYLHALTLSRGRSMYNDWFHDARVTLDTPDRWEQDPGLALVVQAFQHLEWRFEDLSCHEPSPSG